VENGRKAGQSLVEIQKSMPMSSIRALQANGYGEAIRASRDQATMQAAIDTNIEHIYARLGSS
jgi:ribosome-associated translation inhibitor RaiA